LAPAPPSPVPANQIPENLFTNVNFPTNVSQGGNDSGAEPVLLNPQPAFPWPFNFPVNASNQMTGGRGHVSTNPNQAMVALSTVWKFSSSSTDPLVQTTNPRIAQVGNRFNNTPTSSNSWRAGGGGAIGNTGPLTSFQMGAGGGGGRGNAGNPGGAGGGGYWRSSHSSYIQLRTGHAGFYSTNHSRISRRAGHHFLESSVAARPAGSGRTHLSFPV
jgi:hypothetical protein